MTIKTRLTKLEAAIDPNVCPVCGLQLPAVTETRARMELFVARYQQEKGVTRAAAIVRVCDHAPLLMRRAGFLPIIPAGHCAGCGKDLRPAEEIAQRLLAQYTEALGGDRDAALAAMRVHAPSLAAYLP